MTFSSNNFIVMSYYTTIHYAAFQTKNELKLTFLFLSIQYFLLLYKETDLKYNLHLHN